jgi:hypothetical protein
MACRGRCSCQAGEFVFVVGPIGGPNRRAISIATQSTACRTGIAQTSRRRLGLTYSAERYGEKSSPSPFLFEIGGKERRHCIWTGPRSTGANERLPLITASEQQWLTKIPKGINQGRKASPAIRSGPEPQETRDD